MLVVQGVPAGGLRWITGKQPAGQCGDFIVLRSSEFLILQPEVALDDFRGGQEAQDRSIAFGERAAAFFREKRYAICDDSRAQRDDRSGNAEALQEGASSDLA